MEDLKPVPAREIGRPTVATEAQWIDVHERIPDRDQKVIVYAPYWSNEPFMAVRKHFRWDAEEILSSTEFSPVTHWMPLPAPPTAARKGE